MIQAEASMGWTRAKDALTEAVQNIERLAKLPEATPDDKATATQEIAFLRSLIAKL
jgi:hypothetical protein